MGVQKMDHSPVSCPERTVATRAVAYGKANSPGRYRGDLEGNVVTDTPDSSIELCIAKAIPNPNDEQERLCLSEAIANEENERLKYTGSIDPLTDVSIPRIIRFAVPAVGIWLCSPLLSVIDTATVGMMSGTVQQAALHPAVAITDYTARLMFFLFTATTNLVAISFESDRSSTGRADTACRNTLISSLRVSLRVGICICAILLVFCTPMLRALLGRSENLPVLRAAQKHVWIRALGMPAAAMIGSAQAACLGMQDTKSPLMTTLLAAIINFAADLILVRQRHPWVGGVAGAAWATILSQYIALGFYLYWLIGKRIPGEAYWQWTVTTIQSRMALFGTTNGASSHRILYVGNPTVRGILGEDIQARDFFIRASGQPSSAKDFMPYVIPVTVTQVGRCSVYAAMGIVVAGMDVDSMAANQIISSFFYALLPFADSLGQTAQALLPPIFSKDPSEENQRGLQRALQNFLIVSLWCGVWLACAVGLMPIVTKTMMTTDQEVQSLVNSVVPIFVTILLFQGLFYTVEGILLAQKDLSFVGRLYGVYFVIFPVVILQLQRLGTSLQLWHVWVTFTAYQSIRISVWVVRVYFLFRRRAGAIVVSSLEELSALHVDI